MPEQILDFEGSYGDYRRGNAAVGAPVPQPGEWAEAMKKQFPEHAAKIDTWLAGREPESAEASPSNRDGPAPASSFLKSAMEQAYNRDAEKRSKAGEAPLSPGAFVDRTARAYEERGEDRKGRKLRDAWAQRQASELPRRQNEADQAVRAAGDDPNAMDFSQGGNVAWSNVEPRRMVEALEAAGVRTEGLLEPEVRQAFMQQFGGQIKDDAQAEEATSHLWVRRANEMAMIEAGEFDDENPGLPPSQAQRFEDPGHAKSYISRRMAELDARKAQEAAENPARHTAANIMGSVARGITMNVPWQLRDDDLTAEDSINVFLAGLFGGQDEALQAMGREEREALGEYRDTSMGVGLMLEGAELFSAGKGPLGLLGRAAHGGLKAVKLSERAARWLSGPLSLGIYSALSTDGDWGERSEAGLHGMALGGIAGPAGRRFQSMLGFVPSRVLKASAAEAGAFVAAEWVLKGFELTDQEAVHAALFGGMMGASGAADPLLAGLSPAKRKVYKAHRKTLKKAWKAAMKEGWKQPWSAKPAPLAPKEVLASAGQGAKVPKGAPSAVTLSRGGEVQDALARAQRLQKAHPEKSVAEVVKALDIDAPLAAEVSARLGKQTTREAKKGVGLKREPQKPSEPTREAGAPAPAEGGWDALLAKARRLRQRGAARGVGALGRSLKVDADTARRVDDALRAEGQEGGRLRQLAKKVRSAFGSGPYPNAGVLGRRYGLDGETAKALLSRLNGEAPPAPPTGGTKAAAAKKAATKTAPTRRAADIDGSPEGAPRGRRAADYTDQPGDSPEVARLKLRERRRRRVAEGRKKQAHTDRMTGIGNLRAAVKARVRAAAVGVFDVVGLGKVNSGPGGQPAGDRLLKKRLAALKKAAAEEGIPGRDVFRVGGDEFEVHGTVEQLKRIGAKLNGKEWYTSVGKDANAAGEGLAAVKKEAKGTVLKRPKKAAPKPKADAEPAPEPGLSERDVSVGKRIRDTETGVEGVIDSIRSTPEGPVFVVETNAGKKVPIPGKNAALPQKRSMFTGRVKDAGAEPGKWRKPDGFEGEDFSAGALRKHGIAKLREIAEAMELPVEGVKRKGLLKSINSEVAARKNAARAQQEESLNDAARAKLKEEAEAEAERTAGTKADVVDAAPPEATVVATAPRRPRLDGKEWAAPGETPEPVKLPAEKFTPDTGRKALEDARSRTTAGSMTFGEIDALVAKLKKDLSKKDLGLVMESFGFKAMPSESKGRIAEEIKRQLRARRESYSRTRFSPDEAATGEGSPITYGRDATIRSESGEPVQGKYAVVEGGSVLPSHNPKKGFEWNEGYPRENNLQERDYSSLTEEQAKVGRITGGLNPDEVLSTAPRAADGTPTISPDGTVLNGNGRAMGILGAAAKGKAAYRKMLGEVAAHFGVEPEAFAHMKDPMLVRVVEMDPRTRQAADFARTGQESGTQAQSPVRMAARYSHLVGEKVFKYLRDTATATVGDALSDPTKGADFRDALYKELPANERPTYFTEGRKLTQAGKEMVENMLLVRGLSDPTNANSMAEAVRFIETMPDGLRATLKASSVQMVDMARSQSGRAHVNALNEAVRYWTGPMQGAAETPKDFFSSLHIATAPPPPITAEGRMMLDFVHANRNSPRKFREGMKRLVEIHGQESGLFAGESDLRAQMATALGVEEVRGVKLQDQSEFGMPDVFSSERINELDHGYQNSTVPNPILGPEYASPNRRTGFALDMPLPTEQQPGYAGKKVGARKIMRALERLVGTPIRVGHMDPIAAMKYAGLYQVGPELIRIRYANDIPTGAHETAHAIEKAIFWNLGRDPSYLGKQDPRVLANFERWGRDLYGQTIPAGGYVREGFAEFIRFKLTDPAKVEGSHADKFWNDVVLKKNPKLRRRFEATRKLVDQYQAQGLENRKVADVHRGKLKDTSTLADKVIAAKTKFVEAGEVLRLVSDEASSRRGSKLAPSEDPFALLTGLRLTHTARARYMTDTAMIDPAGNIRGGSLQEAAALVSSSQRDAFTLHLWGRRAKERILGADAARLDWAEAEYLEAMGASKKDLKQVAADLNRPLDEVKLVWEGARKGGHPGLSLGEAMELVARTDKPEFQLAAQKVYRWNRQLLEYAYHSGAIGGEEMGRILKGSQEYIPLQRAMESLSMTDATRALTGGSPLKRFKGSGEAIRDPFEVMVENAERIVRWSHEKMVTNALARLAIPAGEGGYGVEGIGKHISEIPKERIKELLPIAAIERQLQKAGLDTSNMDADALIERYRPAHQPKKGSPIITVKGPDGNVRWFEVSRQLWEGVQSMDVPRLHPAIDLIFGTPARALRLGATGLRPAFALSTNPMRDIAVGYLQSKTTNRPEVWLKEWGKSFGESFAAQFGKEFPYHDLFRRLGGEMAQPLGIDTRQTKRAAKELFAGEGWKGRAVRVYRSPVDHLRDFLQFPESATRIAEVRRMAKQVGYKTGGPITMDQSLQMLTSGKRVSIDFTAAGSFARQANQYLPFFNASIQGTRSFMRAMKDAPLPTTLKALGTRTLPAMLLWLMNRDKDWYQDMPWREKFSYFWFDPGGGELVAIPRAFDWDNVWSIPFEAVADALYQQDSEGIGAMFEHLFETSPAAYLKVWENSPAITVPLELAMNESFYKGTPIVPKGQMDLPNAEQVAPYSSGVARWVGEALDVSPRKIDHAIRGFTGGTIHDTAGWADWAAGAVTGTNPGIGFRSPSRGMWKDVPVFGQATGRRGGKEGTGSRAVNALWEDLIESRKIESSTEHEETSEQRAYRMRLEDAAIAIKFLRKIQGDASLSGDEAQEVQREIRRIAREAVDDPDGGRMKQDKKGAERRFRGLEEGSSPDGAKGRSMFNR